MIGSREQMSDQPAPIAPIRRSGASIWVRLLFNSRWLMAPFYFGLVVALRCCCSNSACCCGSSSSTRPAPRMRHHPRRAILIDVSLTGNLILIVVFSGYENFVSNRYPRPSGLAGLDDQDRFRRAEAETAGLDRRDLGDPGAEGLHEHRRLFRRLEDGWLVGVHLVFVVSALVLALSDRWSGGDHGGE